MKKKITGEVAGRKAGEQADGTYAVPKERAALSGHSAAPPPASPAAPLEHKGQRAMADVLLSQFNTVTLAANVVSRLLAPAGRYYYYLMNLGPGTLYIRADADPSAGDPLSETLPANAADNQIQVASGETGLRVVSDQASIVSVRTFAY